MHAQKLEDEIKVLIIGALALEDLTPEEIDARAPLFGTGLGLDSIDALELGIALQKRFGVKMEGSVDDNRRHFASVEALAAFVSFAVNARQKT